MSHHTIHLNIDLSLLLLMFNKKKWAFLTRWQYCFKIYWHLSFSSLYCRFLVKSESASILKFSTVTNEIMLNKDGIITITHHNPLFLSANILELLSVAAWCHGRYSESTLLILCMLRIQQTVMVLVPVLVLAGNTL